MLRRILKDEDIFVAARYDVRRLKECLIDKHNHINCTDCDGDTPLMHAAMVGKLDCLEYLLQNGADPNIQNKVNMSFLRFLNFVSGWKNSFNGGCWGWTCRLCSDVNSI